VRCGLWEVDRPGWLEADTVSHGGGGSSGEFMWSLTLTGIHTGWTELAGLWGGSGREVCAGLKPGCPLKCSVLTATTAASSPTPLPRITC
jgi:hypothetical protein